MADKKIKITQTKSTIGYRQRTKDTLRALGIRKMNHFVIKTDSPAIRGMICKVQHLVEVQEI